EAKRCDRALAHGLRWMLDLPIDTLDQLSAGRRVLRDVVAACDDALQRVPKGGGRTRMPGAVDPRLVCATIVSEVWACANGQPRGAHNDDVQQLCDNYWRW